MAAVVGGRGMGVAGDSVARLPLTFEFLSVPFYAPLDRLQFRETFLSPRIGRIHDVDIALPNRNFPRLPPK